MTDCPLPEKPDWHPDATREDAASACAIRRVQHPNCARIKFISPSYCAMCLREVVPWRLPSQPTGSREARTPSATVTPALGVTPAVADGVARRKWQR